MRRWPEYNTVCEVCDQGSKKGKLQKCWSCNAVWHKDCNSDLRRYSRGERPKYWQCDECVQEEMREFGTALNRLRPATDAKDRGEADEMVSTRQESAAGSGGEEESLGLLIHPGQTATSVTTEPHVSYRSRSVPPDRIRAGKRKVSTLVCARGQCEGAT